MQNILPEITDIKCEVIFLEKGSLWSKMCGIPPREKLKGDTEIEVAVIGAGLAGILIAFQLQNEGKKVIVLEGNRIVSGQTKNTTAKITAQHGEIYNSLITKFGKQTARYYADCNLKAVEWYRDFITKNKIDCDFEDTEAWLYSSRNPERIKQEYEACKELKMPVELLENTKFLEQNISAVVMKNQAQFNPLLFIKCISENLEIYEQSYVTEVKDRYIIGNDFCVKAEKIVFACHYPFVNFPALYFARLHQERSYVISIEDTSDINRMYYGIDSDGISLRRYKDKLFIGGSQHRTGENLEGDKYDSIRKKVREYFPNSKETECWSAQDCITADSLPYIGVFSKSKPYWYVATGFGKWGMTFSAVAAQIITELITEKNKQETKIFSPARCSLSAVKGIAKEGFHSAKGLIKRAVFIPKEKLEKIGIGCAGSVFVGGRRLGVFRESEENYYCVSLKCPHLGCKLEWNGDEKSWDCPCHGSRFNYKGELIDNPAQRDITIE